MGFKTHSLLITSQMQYCGIFNLLRCMNLNAFCLYLHSVLLVDNIFFVHLIKTSLKIRIVLQIYRVFIHKNKIKCLHLDEKSLIFLLEHQLSVLK